MAKLPLEETSGICFDAEPPLKKARAAQGPSSYSEETVTVNQSELAQQEEGAGPPGTDGVAENSDPEAAVEGKREAYYSANFKAVLDSVLGSSHELEWQAVGKDSLETVRCFLTLTGTCTSTSAGYLN